MGSFYFSRVPKFKIRNGGVVGEKEDIPSQPPVLRTASVLVATIPLKLKATISVSSTVLLMPEVAVGVSSTVPLPKLAVGVFLHCSVDARSDDGHSLVLHPEESLLLSENVRQSDKGKKVINDEGEKTMPKKNMEDEDSVEDSRKAKRGRETPLRRARENILHPLSATQTFIPPLHQYWVSSG
ncbi:hypothetical protein Fot_05818 [Forsythia ovata]|uniref:Uncharacterized protein n=1 Tax=Forsythia ovata TaxID=205694 RepID=A0ABD1WRB6_9LAMI